MPELIDHLETPEIQLNKLSFGWELVEKLPPSYTRVGGVLGEIVPHLFRATRQHLGHETLSLQAVLPILMLLEPMLFQWDDMAGDVETNGDLTRGSTVFDMRDPRQWRTNMAVANSLDVENARDTFYNCLKYASHEL